MKLSLTFLALAIATVQADLTSKWNLDFLSADQVGSLYTFTYQNIGDEMLLSNMQASVTVGDCSGAAIASNDGGVATLGVPVDGMTLGFTPGADPNTGTAVVGVDMSTKTAAADGTLWTALGTEGGGTLSFCVRYGLFAAGNEINFSETEVSLVITMVGGFEVPSFTAAEKEKTESTQAQEYTVTAALCSTGDGAAGAFLQGSLICVKVSPSSTDVEITSITTFGWTNSNGQAEPTTQSALPLLGGDGLSSYDELIPDTFSTILYAQFYESGIPVSGSGSANLGFTAGRRLGSGNNGRVLQEIDAVQEFDIVADIVKSEDSPTALQTAGGATASFVVTIVGLIGAVLLA
jgi:FlaG/FlaF family flagellin (archaellin)